MQLRRSHLVLILFAICFPLLLSGCTGKKSKGAEISGTVTFAGKPLPMGKLVFHGSDGKSREDHFKDGEFKVKGVPVGDVKVTVETEFLKGMEGEYKQLKLQYDQAKRAGGGKPGGEDTETLAALKERMEGAKERFEKYTQIPAKYWKNDTTPLSYTISNGDTIEIKLTK